MTLLGSIASVFAQRGVQAVAAGLVAGVVGGTGIIASGIVPVGGTRTAGSTVPLMACPGSGAVVADSPEGQSVLVTARSADGGWLQVYVGQPGIDRAWVPATAVRLEGATDALPVGDCAAPSLPPVAALPSPTPLVATPSPALTPEPTPAVTGSPSPTPEPTATRSATPNATAKATATPKPTAKPTATPTPTPKPTPTKTPKPTPTPTPTPVPDTTPPSLSSLTTTGFPYNGQYYIYGPSAPCTPHSATIEVTATDASGVVSVTLSYWPGGENVLTKVMSPAGGNRWQATINAQDAWAVGLINYWVEAVDERGNKSDALSHSNSYVLNKGDCIT